MSSARDFARVVVADTFGKPFNGVVDAVLAALGIPADAGADDVRAAMLMWTHPEWEAHEAPGARGFALCEVLDSDHYPTGVVAGGTSRAAAVLALATNLAAQEATDA